MSDGFFSGFFLGMALTWLAWLFHIRSIARRLDRIADPKTNPKTKCKP